MGVEIERKFRVRGLFPRDPEAVRMQQAYLKSDGSLTVRVRLAGQSGFLTLKGPPVGLVRPEFEYCIPAADARFLMDNMRHGAIVEKIRHRIPHENHVWDVDEFLGDNAGLVVAEIELKEEAESFDRPGWVGDEVTGDSRYYNASLSVLPFRDWPADAKA